MLLLMQYIFIETLINANQKPKMMMDYFHHLWAAHFIPYDKIYNLIIFDVRFIFIENTHTQFHIHLK